MGSLEPRQCGHGFLRSHTGWVYGNRCLPGWPELLRSISSIGSASSALHSSLLSPFPEKTSSQQKFTPRYMCLATVQRICYLPRDIRTLRMTVTPACICVVFRPLIDLIRGLLGPFLGHLEIPSSPCFSLSSSTESRARTGSKGSSPDFL